MTSIPDAPTVVPSGAPPATPIDATQVFYDGSYAQDPVSHDFNANPGCGGEPELWAGLLTFTPDLEPKPDWAQTWEVAADGTTWTFHLRPDNRGWSNGDQLTAADFVWSWQRKLLPATAASDAAVLFPIQGAAAIHAGTASRSTLGASALDDWTLQARLTAPSAAFLDMVSTLATVPAHRPSVERYGASWTEAGRCVSNGPFQLDGWERGTLLQFSPNPGYWDAGGLTLTQVQAPITPADRALIQYRLDRLDQIGVIGSDLPGLQADPTLGPQLRQTVGNGTWALFPQTTVRPFDDVRVRRAAAHAVDRHRLVEIVSGRALPATSLLPPGFPAHVGTPDVAGLQSFDVGAALDALKDTPFSGGGNWPPVTLLMRQEDPDSELLGRDVAAQLEENLGMSVSVTALDPAAFDAALRQRRAGLIWLRSWYATPDPADAYGRLFSGVDTAGPTTWRSADLDALLAGALGEVDLRRRLARYAQGEHLLQQEVAYVPAVYPVSWYLVKPWVTGTPVDQAGWPLLADRVYTRRRMPLRIVGRPLS